VPDAMEYAFLRHLYETKKSSILKTRMFPDLTLGITCRLEYSRILILTENYEKCIMLKGIPLQSNELSASQ